MNKFIGTALLCCATAGFSYGQANISPAKAQNETIMVTGATLHLGNGKLIENGFLVFEKGKITEVGNQFSPKYNQKNAKVIDANGKHVYPGFIAPSNNLGLVEIEAAKATVDDEEIGEFNSHIRSIIAYNTDSKVPATLRSNGILMAQITPQGG
ncbi:MAG: amidohydrolase, partial [Sphingobacteriaceae bacterium]|nr:amidohydrolase [Sphingobacteriaceae bacterium]